MTLIEPSICCVKDSQEQEYMQGDGAGSHAVTQERKNSNSNQSAHRAGGEDAWILDVLKAVPTEFTGSLDVKFQRKIGCESQG